MRNLSGRLRTWFQLRRSSEEAESAKVPPALLEELPVMESDIVIIEADPDAEMRAWNEAFAATAEGRDLPARSSSREEMQGK